MSIEESIKVLDEIAEGFENLSAEVCARNDLRALWAGRAKGIRQAIAMINAHLRVQPNDPLTLEQLREMDGEPVWLSGDGLNRYDIFRGERSSGWADFYCGRFSLFCYGKDWLAYRRRPEELT